jgi:hypothetical protein
MVSKSPVVCHLLGGSGRTQPGVAPVRRLAALFVAPAPRHETSSLTDRLAA